MFTCNFLVLIESVVGRLLTYSQVVLNRGNPGAKIIFLVSVIITIMLYVGLTLRYSCSDFQPFPSRFELDMPFP